MVVKAKSVWCCQHCGHNQSKWAGQCPQCREWNALIEEMEIPEHRGVISRKTVSKPLRLNEIQESKMPRIRTDSEEFNRLMGGGIVPGALTLIGGEPGIGKSTLMLQLANSIAKQNAIVLYVTGEESMEQIALRAKRLKITTENLLLLTETNFEAIRSQIEQINPDCLIIDSIQLIYKEDVSSAPGSVTQVRENAAGFMYIAKGLGICTFLIGHVTKSGEIAGPRILEHLVDTVLYFEGDKQHNYRMIRVVKNRFGATDEVAVFQMQKEGLAEVRNPSQIFLEERVKKSIGSAIIATLEGTRPILIEAQSLVTETAYSTPSRRSTGIDSNRLNLLLAVLEKRMRYQLWKCDVFVSITGGFRITEPSVDLGILLAIASSFSNRLIDPETMILGEVGLGGEVRSVTRIESRIKEAQHMGFRRCILPKRNVKGISSDLSANIELVGVELVEEAIERCLK